MNKRSIVSLISILFLVISAVSVFRFIPSVNASTQVKLWIKSYDATKQEWNKTGNSPYLTDTDGDYIQVCYNIKKDYYYKFQTMSDVGLGTVTWSEINSIFCFVEDKDDYSAPYTAGGQVSLHYDGSDYAPFGNWFDTYWHTEQCWGDLKNNPSEGFTNLTQLNDARLWVQSIISHAGVYIYLRRAYLLIDYSFEALYVNSFDDTRGTGWQRIGASPYLNAQDQPTNYINSTVANKLIGDFDFEDLPSDASSIISVTLEVYGMRPVFAAKIRTYIYNGTWNKYVDVILPLNSWGWDSYVITSTLPTVALVNNVTMYLDSQLYGAYGLKVDCIKLAVLYEIAPPTGEFSYSFTETIKPSASLKQYQEQKYVFTQTIILTANSYEWQEVRYIFQQTMSPHEIVIYYQEQFYLFSESIKPLESSFHSIESILMFVEYTFTEPINIKDFMINPIEHPVLIPPSAWVQTHRINIYPALFFGGFCILIFAILLLTKEKK